MPADKPRSRSFTIFSLLYLLLVAVDGVVHGLLLGVHLLRRCLYLVHSGLAPLQQRVQPGVVLWVVHLPHLLAERPHGGLQLSERCLLHVLDGADGALHVTLVVLQLGLRRLEILAQILDEVTISLGGDGLVPGGLQVFYLLAQPLHVVLRLLGVQADDGLEFLSLCHGVSFPAKIAVSRFLEKYAGDITEEAPSPSRRRGFQAFYYLQ